MKSRAAVAFEAGKPLEIVEVDLEGQKLEKFSLKSKRQVSATPMHSPCQAMTLRGLSPPYLAMKELALLSKSGLAFVP